jgi:hypothetical protein
MSNGQNDFPLSGRSQQYDISGTQDPRVLATLGVKGTTYRRVGDNGGTFFIKQDDGVTTNWLPMATGFNAPGAPGLQNLVMEDTGLVFTPQA